MPVIVDQTSIHEGWGRFLIVRLELDTGETISREVEDHGSAVAVLPFDPVRRVAVLVGQFRPPVFLSGGPVEILEVPAGRLDGDASDLAGRREVQEEAGLRLRTLEPVGRAWSMPGVSTETVTLFLAPFEPADRTGPGGGLAQEGESIRVVEIALFELARMQDAAEILDMKTGLLVAALRLRRPDLFS